MSYRVVNFFTDLQDNNHPYNVGDEFPRVGMVVSDERLNELMSDQNKQRRQLIERVDDVEETSEKKKYDEESLSEMTSREIKLLAADLGYKITKTSKASVIEQFLEQQG